MTSRDAVPFTAITAIHFLTTAIVYFWSLIANLPPLEPSTSPVSEVSPLLHIARQLLAFPLVLLAEQPEVVSVARAFDGVGFYAVLLLNSMCWAAATILVFKRIIFRPSSLSKCRGPITRGQTMTQVEALNLVLEEGGSRARASADGLWSDVRFGVDPSADRMAALRYALDVLFESMRNEPTISRALAEALWALGTIVPSNFRSWKANGKVWRDGFEDEVTLLEAAVESIFFDYWEEVFEPQSKLGRKYSRESLYKWAEQR